MKSRWLLALWLACWGALLAGCASTDPENQSARPWNAPKSWETGLPTGILEGR